MSDHEASPGAAAAADAAAAAASPAASSRAGSEAQLEVPSLWVETPNRRHVTQQLLQVQTLVSCVQGADTTEKAFDLCLYLLSSMMADNTSLQVSNARLEQQLAVVNSYLQNLQQQQRWQQDLERRDVDIINALEQLQLGTSTLLAAQPAESSPQSEQLLHEVLRLVRQLLSSSSGTAGPPSGGGSPRGSGSGSGSVSLHPLNAAGGAATPPLTPLGLGQQQQQYSTPIGSSGGFGGMLTPQYRQHSPLVPPSGGTGGVFSPQWQQQLPSQQIPGCSGLLGGLGQGPPASWRGPLLSPAPAAGAPAAPLQLDFKGYDMATKAVTQQLGKVPAYEGITAVAEFQSQIEAAFGRIPPQLLSQLSEADLASAVVGRLNSSKEMKQVISSSNHLSAPSTRAQVFAALSAAFPTDRVTLLTKLSNTQQQQGASAEDHLAALRKLYGVHRVPLPASLEDLAHLLPSFRHEVSSFLSDFLRPLPADQVTWATLREGCIQADARAAHKQQQEARDQRQRQQPQPRPNQQQQPAPQQHQPRGAAVDGDGGRRRGGGGYFKKQQQQQQQRDDLPAPDLGLGDVNAAPQVHLGSVQLLPKSGNARPEQQRAALAGSLLMAGPLRPFTGASSSSSSSPVAALAAVSAPPSSSPALPAEVATRVLLTALDEMQQTDSPGLDADRLEATACVQKAMIGLLAAQEQEASSSSSTGSGSSSSGPPPADSGSVSSNNHSSGDPSALVANVAARRRPRGAEHVVPEAGAPAGVPPGPVAQPQRSPNRVHHVVGKAPLGMSVEDLAVAIADPKMAPFREALQALWKVIFPGSQEPTPAVAAAHFLGAQAAVEPSHGQAQPAVAAVAEPSSAGAHSSGGAPPPAGSSSSSGPLAAPQDLGVEAHMGAVQPTQEPPSSSDAGDYAPFLAAATTDTVVYQSCEQFTVPGDFGGRHVSVTIDPGAALSIFDQGWLKHNKHVVFHPGSSAELCKLHEPRALGSFFTGSSSTVSYVVRNAQLGLGDGRFPVNFHVVPNAAFDITLGLDFLWGYAAKLVSRSISNRGSGQCLVIPVPQQLRKKGMPAPEPPRWVPEHQRASWVPSCRIRARYCVHTLRAPVDVVACGSRHTLVLTASGAVFAWGWNKYGQCCRTATVLDLLQPGKVSTDHCGKAVAVSAGRWHSVVSFSNSQHGNN